MELRRIIRQLIYAPQLSAGRRTFLHFFWNGKAWSLRDFSAPGVEPTPRYRADPDLDLTVEQILEMARASGIPCLDAPAHPVTDVPFWHERTGKANRKYLGVKPPQAAPQAAAPVKAPGPRRTAPATGDGASADYRDRLRATFWRYREEQFAGRDELFDDRYQPGGAQPPVFKPENAHCTVLLRPGAASDEIEAVLSAVPTSAHHQWFRSMTSSQALAQSVFANLNWHGKLGLLADLRGEDRLPVFPSGVVRPRYSPETPIFDLEYHVNYLGEPRPTSVDVMLGDDYRVAVECKLSEAEIGSCSRPELGPSDSNYETDHCDGAYTRQRGRSERCALTERGITYWRYVPQLLTWPADADLPPCPLRSTYQLVRNILAACVRSDGTLDQAGHAVLLYDGRNPDFAEGGQGHEAWQAVHSALKNPVLLRRCTWQELAACLRQDAELDWLTGALRNKYGL
jgi:hypothetical protein